MDFKVINNFSEATDYLHIGDPDTVVTIEKEIVELRYLCNYPDIVNGMIDSKESQIRMVKNAILLEKKNCSEYLKLVPNEKTREYRNNIDSLRREIAALKEELTLAITIRDRAIAKIALYERVVV